MEKIKILYFEDSPRVREEMLDFLQSLYGDRVELFMADNLLTFDEMLYEWEEIYDKIIIDLCIERQAEISDEAYERFWNEKRIAHPSLYEGIPMEGWDYYKHVMLKDERTKDRVKDILLLTGYAEIMEGRDSLLGGTHTRLLSKGDESYHKKLRLFLES